MVSLFVMVATIVAVIAVLEVAQVPAVMSGLTLFRPGFHVVAGQLRATSTLIYPTIASMYLEVAFALGLWLLFEPFERRPRLARAASFVALLVIGAGISATFTRAGLVGMFACLLLVGVFRVSRLSYAKAQLGTLMALARCARGHRRSQPLSRAPRSHVSGPKALMPGMGLAIRCRQRSGSRPAALTRCPLAWRTPVG